jgi:DNA repair exonuclease SbcCD nuclease subunit
MEPTKTAERLAVKVAVSGDTHFRDTQYARASRGRDYFDAKVRLVEKTAEAGIKVLIDTGDFFNSSRPSANVIQQATQLNRLLKRLGIAMLTVTGNHDWSYPTWLNVLFPDADPSECGIIPMDDRRVTVDGFVYQGVRPYSPSSFRDNRDKVVAMCEGADVVLMHGTVNGVVECGVAPDRMLDLSELPYVPGLKMIALGDLHYFGFINHRGCLVGYPGSSEMNSSSEPTQKVLPIVTLSDQEAVLHEAIPLRIRPFFTGTIRSQEDSDRLLEQLKPVADQHPVVVAKFSREVPEVITRTYGLLDAQRAVIRFEPLPSKEESPAERAKSQEIEAHGIEYFLRARFGSPEQKNELELSVDLLARGETDAANIVIAYIEKRQQDLAVRENTSTDS